MLETIVSAFIEEVKAQIAELEENLKDGLDFSEVEKELTEILDGFSAEVLEDLLNEILADPDVVACLKQVGGQLGMQVKEYRTVRVRLANGKTIRVRSPYFVKARPKQRRKKKRGPNGSGRHVGLEVLGLIGRCSGNLVSRVVQMAVLCPSLEVAKAVLCEQGIELDVKTIRRFCGELGAVGLERRGKVSLDGKEEVQGYTVVIGIDGGRLRERRRKRGRKKKDQKRPGYHTDWKEPKLFTIYLLDAQGQVVKEFAPLHDATMGDHRDLFDVLERYVRALGIESVARVVFCGDGAKWIWSGVEAFCAKLGLDAEQVIQVIDYTHAHQNLREIADLIPQRVKGREAIFEHWKALLWRGDIAGLWQAINQTLTGQRQEKAMKKWQDYFERNQKRMQYERFKAQHLPCGSGCVESAIRRVINLRLKSAGSFWTRPMAEYFLFLRSQLLSGRWLILMKNVTRRLVQRISHVHSYEAHSQSHEVLKAA